MKSNFLFIFAFLLFMQCNSQKTKKSFKQSTTFENIEKLKGKWYNTLLKVQKNGTETNLKMECQGKSYWEIAETDGRHNLIKHFATGKNCTLHEIKTGGLNFTNGNLNYTENDIRKSETLQKLSDKQFKISEKSFLNGESILVENYYEKK
ncbi:hypothetical protein [Frigoriflavimonas asaccharolytica]|uniref:Lipocalin-like protein n=1 Tax=Frigoriflavimonas asaccharolytica TaxID=2735899 RepID=A0A8J8G6N7_9FLAO|nr:hypothetical protein [Frigoriflavimonas asaccharolytica]NRS92291.1 hypothetical protein [Frigoriflavimonas asaccharolytica]